jgi:hypothetical protein
MTRYFDINSDFECIQCRNYVSTGYMLAGVNNRNHCPYCLWSRHLDLFSAGDRMSACKAAMRPVGLTMKRSRKKYAAASGGEFMLVHNCTRCQRISINRIAADDVSSVILEVFYASSKLSSLARDSFQEQGISLLGSENEEVVYRQLYGGSVIPEYSAATTN